jgi:hypothetical protein
MKKYKSKKKGKQLKKHAAFAKSHRILVFLPNGTPQLHPTFARSWLQNMPYDPP